MAVRQNPLTQFDGKGDHLMRNPMHTRCIPQCIPDAYPEAYRGHIGTRPCMHIYIYIYIYIHMYAHTVCTLFIYLSIFHTQLLNNTNIYCNHFIIMVRALLARKPLLSLKTAECFSPVYRHACEPSRIPNMYQRHLTLYFACTSRFIKGVCSGNRV